MGKKNRKRRSGASENAQSPWQEPSSNLNHVTPTNQLMLPPPLRSQTRPDHSQYTSVNPSHIARSSLSNKERKKKRKQARRSGLGGSESASIISTETASSNTNPVVRAPSPPPYRDQLRLSLSQQEQSVFDKEPERFGVYEYSPDAETAVDRPSGAEKKRKRFQKPTPTSFGEVSAAGSKESESVASEKPSYRPTKVALGGSNPYYQRITSDVKGQDSEEPVAEFDGEVGSKLGSMSLLSAEPPLPQDVLDVQSTLDRPVSANASSSQKSKGGRFICPYADTYNCTKTYANLKDANQHGVSHVQPDKFKCSTCGKVLSRKDKLAAHMKIHDRSVLQESSNHLPIKKIAVLDMPNPELRASSNGVALQDQSARPIEIPYGLLDMNAEVTDAEPEPTSDVDYPVEGSASAKRLLLEQDQHIPDEDSENEETEDEREEQTEEELVEETEESIDGIDLPPATSIHLNVPVTPLSQTTSSHRKRKHAATAPNRFASTSSGSPKRVKTSRLSSAAITEMSNGADKIDDSGHSTADLSIASQATEQPDFDVANMSDNKSATEEESHVETIELGSPNTEGEKQQGRQKSKPVQNGVSKRVGSSKSVRVLKEQQSSLDGFVRRSTSSSAQAPSHKRTRLMTIVPQKSTDISAPQSDVTQRRSVRDRLKPVRSIKGKEKAVSSGEDSDLDSKLQSEDIDTDSTSAADHYKATSVARRTSSLGSRTPKMTKNRGKRKVEESEGEVPGSKSKTNREPVGEGTFKQLAKVGERGRFTDDEIGKLHIWRDTFCDEYDMTTHQFNDMMTATLRQKAAWKYPITKREVIQQYYAQLPYRNRRAMLRFRERHFQNLEKEKWTEDDDHELAGLVAQLGSKWTEIGELMGRSQDFVFQRWRHRLNQGQDRNLGKWKRKEEEQLYREVKAIAAAQGKATDDKNLIIPWGAISQKLGTNRSAQQCSNKWRNSTTRRVGDTYVDVPLSDRIPSSGTKAPRTPSRMAARLSGSGKTSRSKSSSTKVFKSAERIRDSDESEEPDEADDEKEESEDHAEAGVGEAGASNETEDEGSMAGVELDSPAPAADDFEMRDVDDAAPEVASDSQGSSESETETDIETPRSKTAQPYTESNDTGESSDGGEVLHAQPPSQQSKANAQTVSRNPFRDSKTPSKDPPLSQLFAGTQANSSAKRSSSARSIVSTIQDSVVPDRPSPGMSIRKRPLSSPLPIPAPGRRSKSNDEIDFDGMKSPTSFVSAREEDTDNEAETSVENSSDESSNSSSGSESDNANETAGQAPTQSSFWGSIKQTILGSQPASRPENIGQTKHKKNPLANALLRRRAETQSTDEADDDDDNDEDDD